MIIIKVLVLLIIVVLAIYDVIYLEIPAILVYLGILLGIMNVIFRTDSSMYWIYAVLPSMCFICIYFISSEKIGIGDGLALLMSELNMSAVSAIKAFLITSISVFIFSVALIIFRKTDKKIPFVAFIALGHILLFFKENLWVNI